MKKGRAKEKRGKDGEMRRKGESEREKERGEDVEMRRWTESEREREGQREGWRDEKKNRE